MSLSNEQICDLYYELYKKMPNKVHFCKMPCPWFVQEDPRLVDCYKKHLGDTLHTNEIQIEYHKRMQESPENAIEHYKWYSEKLGLDTSEIVELTSHLRPDKPTAEVIEDGTELDEK